MCFHLNHIRSCFTIFFRHFFIPVSTCSKIYSFARRTIFASLGLFEAYLSRFSNYILIKNAFACVDDTALTNSCLSTGLLFH